MLFILFYRQSTSITLRNLFQGQEHLFHIYNVYDHIFKNKILEDNT